MGSQKLIREKRRGAWQITSASSHRIKINRTSLDHLLLGKCADIDKVSNGSSITLDEKEATIYRAPIPIRYLGLSFSWASFCAVVNASAAATLTSGSTPVPSQFVLEMGLMARAKGTPIMK